MKSRVPTLEAESWGASVGGTSFRPQKLGTSGSAGAFGVDEVIHRKLSIDSAPDPFREPKGRLQDQFHTGQESQSELVLTLEHTPGPQYTRDYSMYRQWLCTVAALSNASNHFGSD